MLLLFWERARMGSDGRRPLIIRVGPDEADPYRIAHHSRYPVWAEIALRQWLEENAAEGNGSASGGDRNMDSGGYRITDFQCKYIAPALRDEEIAVTLRRKAERDGVCVFAFSMSKVRGRALVCTGEIGVRV